MTMFEHMASVKRCLSGRSDFGLDMGKCCHIVPLWQHLNLLRLPTFAVMQRKRLRL